MTLEMLYDGVPLILPTKELREYARKTHMFSPSDYLSPNYNDSLRYSDVTSSQDYNKYSDLELGQLYWPVGAKRYSAGFFLVTEENLAKMPKFDAAGNSDSVDDSGGIRANVNHPQNGYKSKTLFIRTNEKTAEFKMWMLPPRPLFDSYKKKSLWVLPLVDDRYWWWNHTAGTFRVKSCTTWEDLYKNLLGGLGYASQLITVDSIDRKYLFPNKLFLASNQETRLPILLDAIGRSTNTRVILKHNATIHVMNAANSLAKMTTRTTLKSSRSSGGFGSLASFPKSNLARAYDTESKIQTSESGLQDVALRSRDTAGVIPSTITFMVNNNPYKILTNGSLNPIGAFGDDTTNSASLPDSSVHYYTSTDLALLPPATFPRKVSVTPAKSINVPVQAGDKAYDLRKNLIYTADSVTGGGTATWSEPVGGSTVLSKYFILNASSYKTYAKSCPVYAQLPLLETEAEFSKRQLTEFMNIFRDDWVTFQMGDANLILNGIEEIPPSGMHDYVIYQVADTVATKVVRAPYNEPIQDIYIESYLGDESGCDADTYPCGQCKGMQGGSVTSQLYGMGNSSMFLPYSPVQVKNSTLPVGADPLLYPNYHKPPYVVKFCLGNGIGNVALDYHFQTQAMVSVYWNGSKVTSRQINGGKSFTCAGCAQCWGRLTFAKTAKSPAYATVVIEKVNDYDNDAQLLQNQNWYLNMRCVDSQPYPAPRAIACDQKLDEVGGIFTLGMFTSIPVNIPSSSNGIVPNTSVCVPDAIESDFQCGGVNCTIPANLIMSFENAPNSCKWLKDVLIPLQQSVFDGGWAGIHDQFGPTKDIVQAKLATTGNSGFNLIIKDIVNVAKPQVHLNLGTTCLCSPFKLEFSAGDLSPFSCVGTTTKIVIKEA